MQVFIRDTTTKQFVDKNKNWISLMDEAMDHTTLEAAIAFCFSHQLSYCEILLKFSAPSYEVALPLSEAERLAGLMFVPLGREHQPTRQSS